MRADLGDIIGDLDSLNNERAFKRKFESAFSALGFDSYTYVSVDVEELESGQLKDYASNVIYMTNLPPLWVAHYVEETYADADPVIKDCTLNRLPIHWTENYRANARSAGETRMMDDAWENGIRRGLTIPVHGPG